MRRACCAECRSDLLRFVVQVRKCEVLFFRTFDHILVRITRLDLGIVRVDGNHRISKCSILLVQGQDAVFVRDGEGTMVAGENDDGAFGITGEFGERDGCAVNIFSAKSRASSPTLYPACAASTTNTNTRVVRSCFMVVMV